MKENRYDQESFYNQYSQMNRSVEGLKGAGEWHVLKEMLPDFTGTRVLDLGCGFGWHCRYAVENGAVSVTGIDISEKMLQKAKRINASSKITYLCAPIEDFTYEPDSYDIVISSLSFHYVKSFEEIATKVYASLSKGGTFVFSVEHPVFTAYGPQDWCYDEKGNKKHWPVDRYFEEGERNAVFLGETITKYHKTLTTYLNGLLQAGFQIMEIKEPTPEKNLLENVAEMKDELRRPMMLLISAKKP